jgi:hypothetical protein
MTGHCKSGRGHEVISDTSAGSISVFPVTLHATDRLYADPAAMGFVSAQVFTRTTSFFRNVSQRETQQALSIYAFILNHRIYKFIYLSIRIAPPFA